MGNLYRTCKAPARALLAIAVPITQQKTVEFGEGRALLEHEGKQMNSKEDESGQAELGCMA